MSWRVYGKIISQMQHTELIVMQVWAMDQMDQKSDNGLAPAPGVTTDQQESTLR